MTCRTSSDQMQWFRQVKDENDGHIVTDHHRLHDTLSFNNDDFDRYIHLVYPSELEIKDMTDQFPIW